MQIETFKYIEIVNPEHSIKQHQNRASLVMCNVVLEDVGTFRFFHPVPLSQISDWHSTLSNHKSIFINYFD